MNLLYQCHPQAQLSADSLKTWKSSELPLLRALASELIVQRENFIYHLGDEWKRLAIWKLPASLKGNFRMFILDVKHFLGMFPNVFLKHIPFIVKTIERLLFFYVFMFYVFFLNIYGFSGNCENACMSQTKGFHLA